MTQTHRSLCPINLSLEILGDRWTLLILRDLAFAQKRHFRELLESEEGIASNILTDRLARMVEEGLLTKRDDPSHKQKAIYSLTEKSIALVPVLVQLGVWGRKYLGADEDLSAPAKSLDAGGPPLWAKFMVELKGVHLNDPPHRTRRSRSSKN